MPDFRALAKEYLELEPEERQRRLKALRNSPAYKAYKAEQKYNSRLNITPGPRVSLATCLSFSLGAVLGLSHGSKMAALRFRAENAHRLPDTQPGWYFYHKSKNYQAALGGLKEGIKLGSKLGFWTFGFFVTEYTWDELRDEKDFLNTTIASLSVAYGFSVWNRFSIQMTVKTLKTGLAVGLAYGLAQDGLGLMRGRRLAYVDFLRRAKGKDMDGTPDLS